MLPGLFYVWIEALLCTTTAPCDKPDSGRCRTPERSDGGPEGPKADRPEQCRSSSGS